MKPQGLRPGKRLINQNSQGTPAEQAKDRDRTDRARKRGERQRALQEELHEDQPCE